MVEFLHGTIIGQAKYSKFTRSATTACMKIHTNKKIMKLTLMRAKELIISDSTSSADMFAPERAFIRTTVVR